MGCCRVVMGSGTRKTIEPRNHVRTQTAGEVRAGFLIADTSIDQEMEQSCVRCGGGRGVRTNFQMHGWACTRCQMGVLCAVCAYEFVCTSVSDVVFCPACGAKTCLFKCMGCGSPCTKDDHLYKRFCWYEESFLRDALVGQSDAAMDEAFRFLQCYCARQRRKTFSDGLDEVVLIFSAVLGDGETTRVEKLAECIRQLAPFFCWIFSPAVFCNGCARAKDVRMCPGCGFLHSKELSMGGQCMHCAGVYAAVAV